jgi:hypothetical protein
VIKLDGYRALAYKHSGRVYLCSRNDKDFAGRYPSITDAPQLLPDETVIDGEIAALDQCCVVGYVEPGRKRAYLIGVGVSELHINDLLGVARRCQERAFRGKSDSPQPPNPAHCPSGAFYVQVDYRRKPTYRELSSAAMRRVKPEAAGAVSLSLISLQFGKAIRRSDPEMYGRQVKEGYLRGVEKDRPAVISVMFFGLACRQRVP